MRSAGQYQLPPLTTLRLVVAHSFLPAHGPCGSTPAHLAPHAFHDEEYQSATHSHELPAMSYRPYCVGGRDPTGSGRPTSLWCFEFCGTPHERPASFL